MKLVTFRVDEELYAVNVDSVKSIEKIVPIRPIPHAPEHVVGIMNLRGVVMTVSDLRSILALQISDYTEETRLMVIGNTAYVVDEALDVLDFAEEKIEMRDEASDLIKGVVQDDDRLIVVLDDEVLIAS
nr:purine-binding chemotaxis protein CheW [Bacilli bacterium]